MRKLTVKPSVLKDLRSLPKETRGRAALTILELVTLPFPNGLEKLKGYDRLYRVRVGHYRIIYEVTEADVTIIAVGRRKDIYRELG